VSAPELRLVPLDDAEHGELDERQVVVLEAVGRRKGRRAFLTRGSGDLTGG